MVTIVFVASILFVAVAVFGMLRMRNMHLWILSYLKAVVDRRQNGPPGVVDVYFCFADHYEPYGYGASREKAHERVKRWAEGYPPIALRHRDSDGRHPVHSFFYPAEEYDPVVLDHVKTICSAGLGDVEVHLHHDNDTAENLERTLDEFKNVLFDRHGFLRRDPDTGEIVYCFIHGNWALDNSRPDGRWCGVDNELEVLIRTGCRCDMTMPSAPSDTQTRKINSIYFARGCAGQRKSHNDGRDVVPGEASGWSGSDELLMVQGPLCLNWRSRKLGLVPRIESAEISYDAPPTAQRVALWERFSPRLRGAENHVFIKVHTHGAGDKTTDMLFSGGFDTLWSALEAQFRDRPGYRLHYVSAWEMYQKIRAVAMSANGVGS